MVARASNGLFERWRCNVFTLGLPTLSEGSIVRTVEDLTWDFLEEILKRLEVEDGLHWVTFSKKMMDTRNVTHKLWSYLIFFVAII